MLNDQGQSGRSGRDETTDASTTDMIISENFKILENFTLWGNIYKYCTNVQIIY